MQLAWSCRYGRRNWVEELFWKSLGQRGRVTIAIPTSSISIYVKKGMNLIAHLRHQIQSFGPVTKGEDETVSELKLN